MSLKISGATTKPLAAYDQALALKPDLAEAQCNEALTRLLLGETESGWKKYEYRWDTKADTRGCETQLLAAVMVGGQPYTKARQS